MMTNATRPRCTTSGSASMFATASQKMQPAGTVLTSVTYDSLQGVQSRCISHERTHERGRLGLSGIRRPRSTCSARARPAPAGRSPFDDEEQVEAGRFLARKAVRILAALADRRHEAQELPQAVLERHLADVVGAELVAEADEESIAHLAPDRDRRPRAGSFARSNLEDVE